MLAASLRRWLLSVPHVRACAPCHYATDAAPGVVREQHRRGHWDDAETRRRFLSYVGDECGVKEAGDWAHVTFTQVCELGGKGLLKRYGYSLDKAIEDNLPHLQYDVAARPRKPRNFWQSATNRRRFLDSLAGHVGVTSATDWGRVSTQDVRKHGGSGLLARYDSFIDVLQDAYPEHRQIWEPLDPAEWRAKSPQGYWADKENVASFLQRAKVELGVEEDADWLRVSQEQIKSIAGGRGLLLRWSLPEALAATYPAIRWEELEALPARPKKSTQRVLGLRVRDIFLAPDQQLVSALQ